MEHHGAATIAKKASAGGTEPGPPARTERKWNGAARVLQAAQLRLQLQVRPGCADGGHVLRPTRGSSSPINPRLDSSSKTDLETCGKYRELKRKLSERALTQRKARAREEPSPGPPASETDARPPGHQPRGGAPAAKRARPRKRANLACGKICTFGPELGFEQRNRFRSLRDTRRTEKKVLRKPPAARPVVGQTFKYIY